MIEGKFYLIKHVGTKYKVYWAPYDPAPKRDFQDWGVAVIDTIYLINDLRPLHLRQTKIKYQPPIIHILRDPNVYSQKYNFYGKDWRGYSINSSIFKGLRYMDATHHRMLGIGSEITVFPDDKKVSFWDKN